MGILLLFIISCVAGQLDLPPVHEDRYNEDRYSQDRYNQDRYNQDKYNQDRYNQDKYNQDRYNQDGYNSNRGHFQTRESDYKNILAKLDFTGAERCTANVAAQWNYETNVNEYTQLQALEAQQLYADFQNQAWHLINKLDLLNIRDPGIQRRLRYLSVVGPAALTPDQFDRYNRVINDMLLIYNSATICAYNDPFRCGLRLYPDISHTMAKSRNWDELQYVWLEWRRRSGIKMKDLYQQLVQLNNDAAQSNNFSNAAELWMFPYETVDFEQEVDQVWETIKPLYEELHAYVRKKLQDFYGPDKISSSAPLPSHILGNLWGQSWSNIVDITLPYPGKNYLDATPEMLARGYTPIDMFRIGEEFFLSINMSAMPPEFWTGSIIVEPGDRPVICQASAWDFCNKIDYRIKMCTKVTMKDLITIHHEMAHIQYFLRYSHLPREFRDGANPGFHEAVGEAIALSVSTPRHMQTLGLANKYIDDSEADLNFLFSVAMEKLVLLPFSIAMDKWRWDAFKGTANRNNFNCHWHRLREQYMGVKPPVLRSEHDFDPGSKYHIPANIPYIRNFVAGVLQFQIYESLCEASGQRFTNDPRKPLHRCDIYKNPAAGRVLGKLMERGSSVPWQRVLEEATGQFRLNGEAVREYFRPLEEWLRSENLRNRELIGWSYDGDYCKNSIETVGLEVSGSGFYFGSGASIQNKNTLILCGIILLTSLLL